MLIVIGVLLTALMATIDCHRHSVESILGKGSSLAGRVAQTANVALTTDDQYALEAHFDEYLDGHPLIAYLFLSREGHIIACAFQDNQSTGLRQASLSGAGYHDDGIRSAPDGPADLEIAIPLADDPDTVLHVGLSQHPRLSSLYTAGSLSFLGILLVVAVVLPTALFLIRKMMLPLRNLAEETLKLNQRKGTFQWNQSSYREINILSSSFAEVISQLETTSQRLDARNMELERARRQLVGVLAIIRTVGEYATLNEVCAYLIGKLRGIMECGHLAMLTPGRQQDEYYLHLHDHQEPVSGDRIGQLWGLVSDTREPTFIQAETTNLSVFDPGFKTSTRIGVFPILSENQHLGALFVGCPNRCHCHTRQLEIVNLLLQECAMALKRAIHHAQDLQDIDCQIGFQPRFSGIVGKDRQMRSLFKLIDDIAPTDAAVLIQGESGTGKELVASAIHKRSLRKNKPFVVINCSAYPASLLESELFGHEKGAFTGAVRQKIGRFEQADGGTVFLDEIGEISTSAQIKLLRVLQTQRFERIGGEKTLQVQVRIIAATNKDLLSEVKKGNFREDLFYRLNVIPIHLPPLRQRCNDIPVLARFFLNQFNREQGKTVKDFRTETMRRLLDYAWPGNVRELENTIEHALVLSKGEYIEVCALPPTIRSKTAANVMPTTDTVVENEKRLLQEILTQTGGNKKLAAKRLGISRSTLYNKIKKYHLTQPFTP